MKHRLALWAILVALALSTAGAQADGEPIVINPETGLGIEIDGAQPAGQVTPANNNSFGAATPMTCGEWYLDQVYPSLGAYFLLSVPKNEAFSVRVSAHEGGSPLDPTLNLYNSLTLPLQESRSYDGKDPHLHYGASAFDANDLFYVKVSSHNGTQGGSSYWFRISWDRPTYLSPKTSGSVDGINFAPGDVLAYYPCEGDYEMLFDASDVGLTLNTTALASWKARDSARFVMSFSAGGNVPGVGAVAPHDVVEFIASDVGSDTAGAFRMFVDGSDVGLSTSGEKIDALAFDSGQLILSTTGSAKAPILGSFADEDVVMLDVLQYGQTTAGIWSLWADMTSLGFGANDLVGLHALDPQGQRPLLFVFSNAYSLPTRNGPTSFDAKDVAKCADFDPYPVEPECNQWIKYLNNPLPVAPDAIDQTSFHPPWGYPYAGP